MILKCIFAPLNETEKLGLQDLTVSSNEQQKSMNDDYIVTHDVMKD